MSSRVITVVLAALLAAVPAAAVTFSFASDDNDDGPTFRGNSGGSMPADLNEASGLSLDGTVDVDLMVDTNGDAAGGVVVIPSHLFFDGVISNFTLTIRGSARVIQWDVAGTFYFTQASSGGLLLAVTFDNALLTTYSPNSFTMGQTATLQSSDDVDAGLDFTSTLLFQSLTGVGNLALNGSEDFAFTFTNIRDIDGGGGLPRLDHGLFLRNWASEGSFSAHAAAAKAEELPDEEAQ
jgi:hypothetical protein